MPDIDPSTRERIVTTLREKHSIPRAGTRSVLDALAAEGFTLIEGASIEYEGESSGGVCGLCNTRHDDGGRGMSDVRILPAGCICGHDHLTDREEPVDLCLECSCDGHDPRCQNCGEASVGRGADGLYACSRSCAAQLAYAASLVTTGDDA